jgi:hypothetical protein
MSDTSGSPQRTQRSRDSSTPAAAADSGSSPSDTSIQAQTFDACVMPARTDSAKDVRPEHSGPATSVMAPKGTPPSSNSSTHWIPVAAIDRGSSGTGVSAEGILSARSDSIFWRILAAESIVSSPYVRLSDPVDVNSLLHHP